MIPPIRLFTSFMVVFLLSSSDPIKAIAFDRFVSLFTHVNGKQGDKKVQEILKVINASDSTYLMQLTNQTGSNILLVMSCPILNALTNINTNGWNTIITALRAKLSAAEWKALLDQENFAHDTARANFLKISQGKVGVSLGNLVLGIVPQSPKPPIQSPVPKTPLLGGPGSPAGTSWKDYLFSKSALYVVGGAACVVGAAWWFLGRSSVDDEEVDGPYESKKVLQEIKQLPDEQFDYYRGRPG